MNSHSSTHPLDAFFNPGAVAIIGASSDPKKLGGRPIRYLREAGFAGHIYPVNSRSPEIQGLPAYATLRDIPGPVDQALIIVPPGAAVQALQDCIDKGIRHVQVLSSGFAEESEEGREHQEAMVALAARHGVRLLGPNCLGVVSVKNHYYATFSTALEALRPQPGGISFATQSGAFGSCAYAMAIQRELGIARIVATGNEADVDVTACIDYLASDPETRVICAAIEGCRDGRRLRQALLKAVEAGKPVILMKVGSSASGQLAAATHTGAIAGDDRIFDVVVRECGAWRAQSIEEMLDIAYLCAQQPLPRNNRAGVLTVSGGIGVLMADDAERHGMTLPALDEAGRHRLQEAVPFALGVNPIDTTARIGSVQGGIPALADLVFQQTDWSTQFIYLAQIPCDRNRFPPMIEAFAQLRDAHPDRLLVLIGPYDEDMRRLLEARGLVIFADPGRAMRAVGGLSAMMQFRRQLAPAAAAPAPRPAPAAGAPRVMNEVEAKRLLAEYGLPMPAEHLCDSATAAVEAAQALGFPVVAKIVSPDIPHKTEMGGVLLGLGDAAAVSAAFDTLMARAQAQPGAPRIDGVLISPMIRPGREVILGVHADPVFGPMVMFGLGGVSVELFQDVAFASVPLDDEGADRLIHSVRASRLLTGWRGQAAYDLTMLKRALLGLSRFAQDHEDRLAGVDVNPMVMHPDDAVCLDALISFKPA